jgi:hypothetical protein
VVLGGAPAAAAAFGNPARPNLIANPFVVGPVAANPDPPCQITTSRGGLAADQVKVPHSWVNRCAFVSPPAGLFPNTVQFGNEGRNLLTGPGFTNIDFSLAKNMTLHREDHVLQFRGDFFNLFNHPNFDIPAHVFGCPPSPQPRGTPYGGASFGRILSANAYGTKPPRQIQLSLRYAF